MKAVILAGGMGTRLSEETEAVPKPMVLIGGKPMLWHIMKIFSHYGIQDFIICCGYRGYVIKEYFANYFLHMSDVTFDMENNKMEVHQKHGEPWRVTLVDTGEKSMTGGRLKRVAEYVGHKTFCMTYGDGLSDVNLRKLLQFHKKNKWLASVTAVQPPGRFGSLTVRGSKVAQFDEKAPGDGGWINGGFFVLEPGVMKYIRDDTTVWERDSMVGLVRDKQLGAFKHDGFWQAMDTLRDKVYLEKLWQSGHAPWKVW
ncbi:MAG: glucose-1-phosphate cytidylyltransferase [Candidatus Omnitrophica bacterium]|nr:glucose-1-phosphate cytidylyltransferase [Candidatus Omnitrophota bacterium]